MFKGVSGKEAYAGNPQSEKIQDWKNSFSDSFSVCVCVCVQKMASNKSSESFTFSACSLWVQA